MNKTRNSSGWRGVFVALLSLATAALAEPPATPVRTLEGHTGSVLGVEFSHDGKTLLTSSRDHTIKLWDPGTGKLQRTLSDHTGDVFDIVFSPSGDLLASSSTD